MTTDRPRPFSSPQRLLLLAIVMLAFGLRLLHLGADSLWYDETVSALLASKPLAAMWAHTARDIHPPLYYALLHFWMQMAGRSEFSLAFFSLTWGMALIPLLAQLGRRMFGPTVGVLAALLYAVNPFAIWYAQEVRMYTLGAVLLTGIVWHIWHFLQQPHHDPRRRLVLVSLLAALAMWTLYYSAFALLALNLFVLAWLWQRRRWRSLTAWLLAQAGALLLYTPWLPVALRQALHPPVPSWRQAVSWGELAITMLRQGSVALIFGQSISADRWWPVGLLLLAIALVPLLHRGRKQEQMAGWLLASGLVGPLLIIFLTSQLLSPLYHVRYVNLYSPFYVILLAAGWYRISGFGSAARPRRQALLTAAFLILLLIPTARSLQGYWYNRFAYEAADDLRGAVQHIADRLGPRDAILVNAGYLYPAVLFYWPEDIGWVGRLSNYPPASPPQGAIVITTGHIDGDPDIGWGDPASDFYAIDHETAAAQLERVFNDFNTVWLLRGYDTVNDPDGFIRQWLQAHGELIEDTVFAGQTYVRVQGWRTVLHERTLPPPFAHPLTGEFSNGIQLLGYDLSPDPPEAGRALRLTLYWRANGPSKRSWKVFNQLLDTQWQVHAQADALPLAGRHPTTQWQPGEIVESTFILRVPADLLPGEYRLISGFYDESNGERLLLTNGDDFITLQTWQLPP